MPTVPTLPSSIPQPNTLHDFEIPTAEEQLLAIHHALAVMPGDPGLSLPMVVRMGAVMARLVDDTRSGGVGDSPNACVESTSTSTSVVSTELEAKAPLEALVNDSGLLLIELDVWCAGTVYVVAKAPFPSAEEAAVFLITHQHEDVPRDKDVRPQSIHVVALDEERLLPSDTILGEFRAAKAERIIGVW